eukprot:Gb_11569 [translate_table: standard]
MSPGCWGSKLNFEEFEDISSGGLRFGCISWFLAHQVFQLGWRSKDGICAIVAKVFWLRNYIVAAGGVEALVALAQNYGNTSYGLQERDVDVHETTVGALWNLAFNAGNAWRIVEEGGVPTLVHLFSSSGSKMARFMVALTVAYMFDRRMDEATTSRMFCENAPKSGATLFVGCI